MYEPGRLFDQFHIAGFQYHEGATVLGKLKPGKKLTLVAEPDNPYDPNAVRIERKGVHLGYIPRACNSLLARMMFYGHTNVVECRVLQVNPTARPCEQVLVGLYLTDKRPGHVERHKEELVECPPMLLEKPGE